MIYAQIESPKGMYVVAGKDRESIESFIKEDEHISKDLPGSREVTMQNEFQDTYQVTLEAFTATMPQENLPAALPISTN